MRIVEPVRMSGSQFSSSLDSNIWTATTANSATATVAAGLLTISSGSNSAGSAQINSTVRARYIAGTSHRRRGNIQLDAGTANNTRVFGVTFGTSMPTYTD